MDSQLNKLAWVYITPVDSATYSRSMYNNYYVESDLINSYSWDTAMVFIQRYSGNVNYANQSSMNRSLKNTGKAGDKVCNIHDISSNCMEWSTEYCTGMPCVFRGGNFLNSKNTACSRSNNSIICTSNYISFRPILYIK